MRVKSLLLVILSFLFLTACANTIGTKIYSTDLLPISDGGSPQDILGQCVFKIPDDGFAKYRQCKVRNLKNKYFNYKDILKTLLSERVEIESLNLAAVVGGRDLKLGVTNDYLNLTIKSMEASLGEHDDISINDGLNMILLCGQGGNQMVITKVVSGCSSIEYDLDANQIDIGVLKLGATASSKKGRGVIEKKGNDYVCKKSEPILVKVEPVQQICNKIAFGLLPKLRELEKNKNKCLKTVEDQSKEIHKLNGNISEKDKRIEAGNASAEVRFMELNKINTTCKASLDGLAASFKKLDKDKVPVNTIEEILEGIHNKNGLLNVITQISGEKASCQNELRQIQSGIYKTQISDLAVCKAGLSNSESKVKHLEGDLSVKGKELLTAISEFSKLSNLNKIKGNSAKDLSLNYNVTNRIKK